MRSQGGVSGSFTTIAVLAMLTSDMTTAELTRTIRIIATERFSRSAGPGGQNVNKVSTAVTLHVPLRDLGLSDEETERVHSRLAGRINREGELVVRSTETRSQHHNRVLAVERAAALIESARRPARKRRPTRAGPAAHERRLRHKRARAQRKRERRAPPDE